MKAFIRDLNLDPSHKAYSNVGAHAWKSYSSFEDFEDLLSQLDVMVVGDNYENILNSDRHKELSSYEFQVLFDLYRHDNVAIPSSALWQFMSSSSDPVQDEFYKRRFKDAVRKLEILGLVEQSQDNLRVVLTLSEPTARNKRYKERNDKKLTEEEKSEAVLAVERFVENQELRHKIRILETRNTEIEAKLEEMKGLLKAETASLNEQIFFTLSTLVNNTELSQFALRATLEKHRDKVDSMLGQFNDLRSPQNSEMVSLSPDSSSSSGSQVDDSTPPPSDSDNTSPIDSILSDDSLGSSPCPIYLEAKEEESEEATDTASAPLPSVLDNSHDCFFGSPKSHKNSFPLMAFHSPLSSGRPLMQGSLLDTPSSGRLINQGSLVELDTPKFSIPLIGFHSPLSGRRQLRQGSLFDTPKLSTLKTDNDSHPTDFVLK